MLAPATDRSLRSAEFLELVRRSRQGRLKVFLGPAAGVGKTYRMLQEAHALRRQGVDVVIGVIDTHGRPETDALVHGLPQVPLRRIEHRGVSLEELDVDAVIARAPEIVLVDEVAHTNAPGSRHRRRYEDVLGLLRAGISVFCAFNVQHLESLVDLVARATGVDVRETVPDAFLRRADQIVNIDLPADDLLERLRLGKVYPPERVAWALEHFFVRDKLERLRELALREVAESIERSEGASGRALESVAPGAVGARLMLCLAMRSPRATALLRKASRLAGRLNAHWLVLHVRTEQERPSQIDAQSLRHFAHVQELARDLGAQWHDIVAEDPVLGILELARAHGVTDIALGRTEQPWYKRVLGLTVTQRLVRQSRGFDLHLLDSQEPPP
jgi:two-component system sensor histidine kinase KdpD